MREWLIKNFMAIERGTLSEEKADKFFEMLNENYETSLLLQESFCCAMEQLGKDKPDVLQLTSRTFYCNLDGF